MSEQDPHSELRMGRVISALLALMFVLSTLVSGTLAWAGMIQSATNNIEGTGSGVNVQLNKLEKNADGSLTNTAIPNAEFYLYEKADPADIQIGQRYVTDSSGHIQVRLQAGEYYFTETDPSQWYAYDHDDNGQITQYPFTVNGDETQTIQVNAYNRRILGSLAVAANVRNADGSPLTDLQAGTQFVYTVTFSDGGSYPYYVVDGENQTIATGGAVQIAGGDTPANLASGGTVKLKDGQLADFVGIPAGVTYTVTQTPVFGYTTGSQNSQGTITGQNEPAIFTNTYGGPGSLTITQTAENADGSPLTQEQADMDFDFTVVINGETYQFTLKSGESKTFEDLPVGAAYSILEDGGATTGTVFAPGKYTGAIMDQDLVLPFVTLFSPRRSGTGGAIEIAKTVTNPDGSDLTTGQKAQQFTFAVTFSGLPATPVTIMVDGTPVQVSDSDNWLSFKLSAGETILLSDLPDGSSYEVDEAAANGYRAGVLSASGDIIDHYTAQLGFFNEKDDQAMTSLTLNKKVQGNIPDGDAQRTYHLILNVDSMKPMDVYLKNGQSNTITDLPIGAAYSVTEDLPAGYALSSVTNGEGTLTADPITASFVNIYTDRIMTKLSGQKTWNLSGRNPKLPASIQLQLKNGATLVDTQVVKPNAQGKWVYSFNVPKYNAAGKAVAYTLREVPVANWQPSYAKGSYNVVNTYTGAANMKVTVSGHKTWKYGSLAKKDYPKSITVLVKAGSKVVVRQRVTAADQWAWSFRLNKYNAKGKAIRYQVGEAAVKGFTAKVKGYNITNTFDAKQYNNKQINDLNQTGDENNLPFWYALMGFSMVVMVAVVITRPKPKYLRRR